MRTVIEHTADGSATLYIPEMDEHYHSIKGAVTESQHIFVDMGFRHSEVIHPRILEIGFGTGLNAYLTYKAAYESGKNVEYTAIEKYPLEWEAVDKLNYTDDPVFRLFHESEWNEKVQPAPGFTLEKVKSDFTEYRFRSTFDLIYFDAFAPEKQPEMWNADLFGHLYQCMNDHAILTTYCAKGSVRRMLQETGLTVERLPGPPGGKREILRAIKQ